MGIQKEKKLKQDAEVDFLSFIGFDGILPSC